MRRHLGRSSEGRPARCRGADGSAQSAGDARPDEKAATTRRPAQSNDTSRSTREVGPCARFDRRQVSLGLGATLPRLGRLGAQTPHDDPHVDVPQSDRQRAARKGARRDHRGVRKPPTRACKVVVEPQVWDQMTPKFLAAHRAAATRPTSSGRSPTFWATRSSPARSRTSTRCSSTTGRPTRSAENARRLLGPVRAEGRPVYCLFHSRNYIGVIYRTDLFKEAGHRSRQAEDMDRLHRGREEADRRRTPRARSRAGASRKAFSEEQADPQHDDLDTAGAAGHLFSPDGKAPIGEPAGVEALTFADGHGHQARRHAAAGGDLDASRISTSSSRPAASR